MMSSSGTLTNATPNGARYIVSDSRVHVDSRDRDYTRFPSAKSFRVTLQQPIKAVKSITLTGFRVPIVTSPEYLECFLVMKNIKESSVREIAEGGGLPSGLLAVVPLIPATYGVTYAYYTPNSVGTWVMEFPSLLPQLYEMYFELYVWVGGSLGYDIYPIPDDSSSSKDIEKNVSIDLLIKHNN